MGNTFRSAMVSSNRFFYIDPTNLDFFEIHFLCSKFTTVYFKIWQTYRFESFNKKNGYHGDILVLNPESDKEFEMAKLCRPVVSRVS